MRIVTLVISAVALMPGVTVPNAIAGFIEDSKANLTLRNFYINTDNRSGDGFSKQEEWGQGFILNYDSGYTEGPVGFGLSTLGHWASDLTEEVKQAHRRQVGNPVQYFR